MGAAVQGVEQGWRRCPDLEKNLRGGDSGSSVVWVGDVGADTAHCGDYGRIIPQGGPKSYGTTTSEREG